MQREAGRDLDALVAQRVFRYTLRFAERAWTDEDWMCSDTPTETNVMAIYAPASLFPSTGAFDMSIPHYSTDIAAAWLVVDYLRGLSNRGVWLEELSGRYSEGYRCGFSWIEDAGGTNFRQAIGDTAPLAICLAALEAMEARQCS